MSAPAPAQWLLDLGNSRLKLVAVQGDRVGRIEAIAHAGDPVLLAAALERCLPARIDVAWLASVAAPGLRLAVLQALLARGARVGIARTQAVTALPQGRLRVAYAEPARLGVDRYLAMLGAAVHAEGGCLVVGVGTALTIDLVDAGGRHHGGRIAPSPTLMRQSLHQRAAQLPAEGGRLRAFADDTHDALASGCLGAGVALVEQAGRDASALLGGSVPLLLHGGGAEAMLPHLPGARRLPGLVLAGLGQWAGIDPALLPALAARPPSSDPGIAACSQEP